MLHLQNELAGIYRFEWKKQVMLQLPQKQPFTDVLQNRCSYKCRHIHEKKRLFHVNTAKFLRTVFLQKTSGGCSCQHLTCKNEFEVRRRAQKLHQNVCSTNGYGDSLQNLTFSSSGPNVKSYTNVKTQVFRKHQHGFKYVKVVSLM